MTVEAKIQNALNVQVRLRSPEPGTYLITTPFLNNMGDPIEIEVQTTADGYTLSDLGAVAGLLFSSNNDHHTSRAHRLLRTLTSVYGLHIDYDEGLLTTTSTPETLTQDIARIATATTAILTVATLL